MKPVMSLHNHSTNHHGAILRSNYHETISLNMTPRDETRYDGNVFNYIDALSHVATEWSYK